MPATHWQHTTSNDSFRSLRVHTLNEPVLRRSLFMDVLCDAAILHVGLHVEVCHGLRSSLSARLLRGPSRYSASKSQYTVLVRVT